MASASQATAAAAGTAYSNLNEKISPGTKRMAGLALAGILTPTVLSVLDNQEENFGQQMASGILTSVGVGAGGILGYNNGHFKTDAIKEAFVRESVSKLKTESQQVAANEGPAAGIKYFADGKRKLLQDIEAIDPKRAAAFNSSVRQIPELGDMIAGLDLPHKTPREVSRMTAGAALGAIASALPAYLAVRGGEIEQ